MGLKDWLGGGKTGSRNSGVENVLQQVVQLRRMNRLEDTRNLLEQSLAEHANHPELLRLHWDVCVQMDHPQAAARSMLRRVQLELRSRDWASAVFHWFELLERTETPPPIDLETRVRLADAMIAGEQETDAATLLESPEQWLEPEPPVGLMIRLAKTALTCRAAGADRLAEQALGLSGVPDSTRRELEDQLAQARTVGLRRHSSEQVVDAPIELAAAAPAVRKLRLIAAVPVAVDGDQVVIEPAGQGRRRMALSKVQGLATARIDNGVEEPWILIDLLLDSLWSDQEVIRTLRWRTLDFDPCALVDGADDFQLALVTLLSNLLAVTQAYPLPDAEAVVGRPFHTFASLRDYESKVLDVSL